MKKLNGVSASQGIFFGPVCLENLWKLLPLFISLHLTLSTLKGSIFCNFDRRSSSSLTLQRSISRGGNVTIFIILTRHSKFSKSSSSLPGSIFDWKANDIPSNNLSIISFVIFGKSKKDQQIRNFRRSGGLLIVISWVWINCIENCAYHHCANGILIFRKKFGKIRKAHHFTGSTVNNIGLLWNTAV